MRTVMSSIMRRRRGLIVAIGDLLSGGLGFDNHNPQTGGPNRKDALATPRQRVSSISSPRKRVLVSGAEWRLSGQGMFRRPPGSARFRVAMGASSGPGQEDGRCLRRSPLGPRRPRSDRCSQFLTEQPSTQVVAYLQLHPQNCCATRFAAIMRHLRSSVGVYSRSCSLSRTYEIDMAIWWVQARTIWALLVRRR